MQEVSFEEALDIIHGKDPRFDKDAYLFVREALDFTQKSIGRDTRGSVRHVTGQELVEGIRNYALQQFGPMALTVFEQWGVHNCQDFGEIVFNMVDIGLLAKTEKDSRIDFEGGYNFEETFRKPFLPLSKQRAETSAPKPTEA